MFEFRWADELSQRAGSREYHHALSARADARICAANQNRAVAICTVIDGKVKPRFIIEPDGTVRPPEGVVADKRETCVRTDRACFCTACRTERRAGR